MDAAALSPHKSSNSLRLCVRMNMMLRNEFYTKEVDYYAARKDIFQTHVSFLRAG